MTSIYSMNSVRVFDLLKSLTQKYNMDANEFWISKISSLHDTLYYILQIQPERQFKALHKVNWIPFCFQVLTNAEAK